MFPGHVVRSGFRVVLSSHVRSCCQVMSAGHESYQVMLSGHLVISCCQVILPGHAVSSCSQLRSLSGQFGSQVILSGHVIWSFCPFMCLGHVFRLCCQVMLSSHVVRSYHQVMLLSYSLVLLLGHIVRYSYKVIF